MAAYVSAHGFGHAVRTAEVVRELVESSRDVAVYLRSTAPPFLFPRCGSRVQIVPVASDAGMVQANSTAVDLAATLARLDEIESTFEVRLGEEVCWIESVGADVVLGDVPPLAFAAAARAGVPSFALANFSWDWVYHHYASFDRRFAAHADRASRCYAMCGMLLRLPLHAEMSAFPRIADVPLIAPLFPCSRGEARLRLGLPQDKPIAVLSLSGPGLAGFDLARLGELSGIVFVTTERLSALPDNVLIRAPEGLDYPTLLAAADAVVTKPGYGIVATCLRNGLRALCARRADFPEANVLEESLLRHGTAEIVEPRDLLECRFGTALRSLLSRPVAPVEWPDDGASRVADIVLRGARR